jgi:purine-nucleoside phosphorylase
MATPHIAAEPGDVADVVLMPGDPLRAQVVAERYLGHPVVFNRVRGMYGATGTFRGSRVSVMAHGMGIPSIGIYSHELYDHFGVRAIIRIGSCGSLQEEVLLRDLVVAMTASTDSAWQDQYGITGHFAPAASWRLVRAAADAAGSRGLRHHVGSVLATDAFYPEDPDGWRRWQRLGTLAVDMEAIALYGNAARLGREALVLLTVSDSLVTGEMLSAQERQETFTDMMEVALDVAVG